MSDKDPVLRWLDNAVLLCMASSAKNFTFLVGILPREASRDIVAMMDLKHDLVAGAKAVGTYSTVQPDLLCTIGCPFLVPV
ncbi:MAG: hypothetical protein ABS88_01345 [Sphingopyxis sp. SCN 67-31]|nr:MAG: hypothetical protein ABS88_01345 [Sphingopyxis sp. SCN 67-31]